MLRMFFTVAGPYKLLPYFLRYYARCGVEHFVFCAFEPSKNRYNNILDVVKRVLGNHEKSFEEGIRWPGKMDWKTRAEGIAELVNSREGWLDDWILYPDLDEFVQWPVTPIRDYLDTLPEDMQVLQGVWLDRISANGKLIEIDPKKSLDGQFPLTGKLSAKIAKTVTHVTIGCRGIAPLTHHPRAGNTRECKMNEKLLQVHHFKWNAVLNARIRRRLAYYRKLGMPNAPNIAELVRYLNRYGGKIRVHLHKKRLEIKPVPKKLGI